MSLIGKKLIVSEITNEYSDKLWESPRNNRK